MQFLKSRKITMAFLAVVIVSVISAVGLTKNNKKVDVVRASANDNVHGFAWSELYGWISFNSTDCDTNRNGKVDSGNCGGDDNTMTVRDYGVKIDVGTGSTTGYAWNPVVGYICFGVSCLPASNTPENRASYANYDWDTGRLSGWAKVLSFGDRGWIQLNNTSLPNKGVHINSGTGISSGWAWGGFEDDPNVMTPDGIGWISFSSRDCDSNGDGVIDNTDCGNVGASTSVYAVTANVNRPPKLSNVDVNYTGVNDPCLPGNTVTKVALKWDFSDDDAQSGYEIELSPSASGPYRASTTNKFGYMDGLSYGTVYHYTLTVFDSGVPSLSASTTGTFTTKSNEYPKLSFTWYAPNPSAEENIMFTGVSNYYTSSAPSTPTPCSDSNCVWSWKTTSSDDIISSSTASSTMITFANKGNSDVVTFTATSISDNLSCSTSTTMNVSEKLPDWVER